MTKTVKAVTKRTKKEVEEGKVYDPITKKMVAIKPIKVQAGGGATRNGVPFEPGPSKFKNKLPVREFVAGQLAFQDTWDGGRGNSTTTTRLVLVRSLEQGTKWGPDAVVVLEDGSLAIVGVNTLRHLPEAFKDATI